MSPKSSSATPEPTPRPSSPGGLPGRNQSGGGFPANRAALGLVIAAILLAILAQYMPPSEMDFFTHLAERRQGLGRPSGLPYFRGPARLPVPQRYIEATRGEVEKRMAASDWKALSLEKKREELLEILFLSGIDTEYWLMPEARQRVVADAYIRAFLLEPAAP